MRTRFLQSILAMLAAAGGVVVAGGSTAMATGSPLPILACTTAGTAYFTPGTGSTTIWTVQSNGSCNVSNIPASPTETVSMTGSGSSVGLGICSGTLPVITNLLINVTEVFTNTVTHQTTTEKATWSLGVSTYPVATPLLVAGTLGSGAGSAFTHIFLQCGNAKNRPSAQFTWVESD